MIREINKSQFGKNLSIKTEGGRAMKLTIDFSEPVFARETVLQIQPTDLNDFYAGASDFDKNNIFFMLLTSLHHYEDLGDKVRAAHLSFLAACYLFIALTPPGSCLLALHYINT